MTTVMGALTIIEDSASSLEETLGLGYFGVKKIIPKFVDKKKRPLKYAHLVIQSALFGMVKWPF